MSTEANNFLMTGGTPSFKFTDKGATAKGAIVSLNVEQQRDIDDGTPLTWDNGDPRMQLKIVLATDDRDPERDDDNGERSIFVKGQMKFAVQEAVRKAGASQIEVGGILAVRYDSDGERKKAAYSPPKQYVAQYKPPVKETTAVGVDDLL